MIIRKLMWTEKPSLHNHYFMIDCSLVAFIPMDNIQGCCKKEDFSKKVIGKEASFFCRLIQTCTAVQVLMSRAGLQHKSRSYSALSLLQTKCTDLDFRLEFDVNFHMTLFKIQAQISMLKNGLIPFLQRLPMKNY